MRFVFEKKYIRVYIITFKLNTNLPLESFLLVYLWKLRLCRKVSIDTSSIAMLHCRYIYVAPLVQGCCTFGAKVLHLYWHYYSKVFTVAFPSAAELRFFTQITSSFGFFPWGDEAYVLFLYICKWLTDNLNVLNPKEFWQYCVLTTCINLCAWCMKKILLCETNLHRYGISLHQNFSLIYNGVVWY